MADQTEELLNDVLGWWWADSAAALAMVPIIGKEGVDSIRGKGCVECGCEYQVR
jgi:hypothetical protein